MGIIDHEAGLSLEVLALSSKDAEEVHIFEPRTDISSKIRIGAIKDENICFWEDRNGELRRKDSYVWIPGDFVMSNRDESRMKDLIEQSEAETQNIVGSTFETQD